LYRLNKGEEYMITFIFFSPFLLFGLFMVIAYFHLDTLATGMILILIGWIVVAPLIALLINEKEKC
ncbi:hypothetical protein, partial [Priestia megaterium]|uniref:hypothetical protein n=2 Tax=Bacillaceae TaxID=186817 RepID=UPI00300A078C